MYGINFFIGFPSQLIPIILLLISVFALAIIGYKSFLLYYQIKPLESFEKKKIHNLLRNHKLDDITSFSRIQNHPLYAILLNLLDSLKESEYNKDKVEAVISESLFKVRSDLEKLLPSLGTISTVAPLLGLLGTVTGMMKSFRAFESVSSKSNQLFGGIDEALITTAMGLIVAIPSLIMYNYFVSRIQFILDETEYFLNSLEPYWKQVKKHNSSL